MKPVNFGRLPGAPWEARLAIYVDWRDWWIGWYRGPEHHYVCPLPCLVFRFSRRSR